MGVNDRDYMRDSEPAVTHSANAFFARILSAVLVFILAIVILRVPSPFYVKIPLLIGVLIAGRYFWKRPDRSEGQFYLKQGVVAEKNKQFDKALRCYELASERLPDDFETRLRLLSLCDSTNRKHKAEKIIGDLDGIEVPGRYFEQFEHIVLKYRDATFVEEGDTYRMSLARV